MKNKPFSTKERLKSFRYAWNGLKILLKSEHNARIHFLAVIIVVAAGFLLGIARMEWIAIILAIGLVITAEIINSAIEYLVNFVSPDYHDLIKKVKDVSASAVLIAAIASLTVGLIIFVPKLLAMCCVV